MKFGGSGYVASFALSELINKNSPWLRAKFMETAGAIANLKSFAEDPNKGKDSLAYGTWASNYLAVNAVPPFFSTPYKGARAISIAQSICHTYVTLNPKIKTPMDFVGKRIGLPTKGSAGRMEPEMLLKYGWGIMDKVKIDYIGFGESIQALRDGMVDVAICNPIYIGVDKTAPSPALDELKALRVPYYYIPIPKEDVIRAREKSGGFPLFPGVLPPGGLDPELREPFPHVRITNGWFSDVQFREDVVYEICRIIYEHHKDFWPYHVSMKGLYPEYMPRLAAAEAEYHPGAIKFYKEKGLKIGVSD
jgi:TRAP transporter TAXI family solute receptor